MYERIIAQAVAWNQCTGRLRSILSQNVSLLYFGVQQFRVFLHKEKNLLQVDVGIGSPLALHQQLMALIEQVVGSMMKSLHVSSWISKSTDPSSHLFSLAAVQDCVREKIFLESFRCRCDWQQLKDDFGVWLVDNALKDRYDLFISFTTPKEFKSFSVTGGDGSQNLAEAVFERLGWFHVASSCRPIDVFVATKRLVTSMHRLDTVCRSIPSSTVFIPIISESALEGMRMHDPSEVDRTLLQWVIALVCHKASGRGIFPVILGEKDGDSCDDRRRHFVVNTSNLPGSDSSFLSLRSL